MPVRIALFFLLLLAPAAQADRLADAAGRYRLAPESRISFHVGQMGGGGVDGIFPAFAGQFSLSAEIERSEVDVTIDPRVIETVDPRITEFLKSEAVFNVDKHPAIRFRSTKVTRTGDRSAALEGLLSARGITRPARFSVDFEAAEGGTIRFRVTGKLSRALFGMEVGTPIYSNMVEFDMALVGQRD